MTTTRPEFIYRLAIPARWAEAMQSGAFIGEADDERDGFIHFSTQDQIVASAAKHRAGQTGLVLLSVDPGLLVDILKWEPARGGALFPHLYGPLPVVAVIDVDNLPLGNDGRHRFPSGFPTPEAEK